MPSSTTRRRKAQRIGSRLVRLAATTVLATPSALTSEPYDVPSQTEMDYCPLVRAFIEVCCDEASRLGSLCECYNFIGKRITAKEEFHTRRGLEITKELITNGVKPEIWGALPCTPWATWTYINEAKLGPAFRSRLAWQRRISLRMIAHFCECAVRAIAMGGGAHFKWPRFCRGWKTRVFRHFFASIHALLAVFDGCSFGVMATPLLLAKKPYQIATTRCSLYEAFNGRLCTGDRQHGILRGAAAAASSFYTDQFCRCALNALSMVPDSASAICVLPVTTSPLHACDGYKEPGPATAGRLLVFSPTSDTPILPAMSLDAGNAKRTQTDAGQSPLQLLELWVNTMVSGDFVFLEVCFAISLRKAAESHSKKS